MILLYSNVKTLRYILQNHREMYLMEESEIIMICNEIHNSHVAINDFLVSDNSSRGGPNMHDQRNKDPLHGRTFAGGLRHPHFRKRFAYDYREFLYILLYFLIPQLNCKPFTMIFYYFNISNIVKNQSNMLFNINNTYF